jgi:SPP1 family predicted phage head-tail adaptor
MRLNPTQLDRKCAILSPTVGRDADGGPTETFTTFRTVWCRKAEIGGREFRASGALREEATAMFTTRYYSDITANCRILIDGRTFEILAPPAEQGRKQFLKIQAAEVLNII